MNFTDMKRSASKEKADLKPHKDDGYSYGHRIRLQDEHIKKLGASDLNVGDEVQIMAHGKVTSKSSHSHESGESSHLEMQITHMGVGKRDAEPDMKTYAKKRNAEIRER